MQRASWLIAFAVALGLSSCQRAAQFPPVAKSAVRAEKKPEEKLDHQFRWREPRGQPRDVPIVFVPDTSAEWQHLPGYWSQYPPIPPYLGQSPLGALSALVWMDEARAIKIKVPRGLPDPTPLIPVANAPTLGKWKLGQDLFFMPLLRAGEQKLACASCHLPAHGFALNIAPPTGVRFDTLSLINVAYNRRQFWDGRVATLEETLVRSLEDERGIDAGKHREKAFEDHIWGGFVRSLVELESHRLNFQFEQVFGIEAPTQDAVARALATYLRTLLRGDSLYDRAEARRREAKAKTLSADHFRDLIKDDKSAEFLVNGLNAKIDRAELPKAIMQGHALFHGKARCAKCHRGPLFSDQDYHNIGYPGADGVYVPGQDTGRAAHVPIGLKETRLIGAYRTPTLRNLAKTSPYFHNGNQFALKSVVEFYNSGVQPTPSRLAAALKDGEREQQLWLSDEEKNALVIFLRTLEGAPLDPVVAGPK